MLLDLLAYPDNKGWQASKARVSGLSHAGACINGEPPVTATALSVRVLVIVEIPRVPTYRLMYAIRIIFMLTIE
jgi:hypothetical protein